MHRLLADPGRRPEEASEQMRYHGRASKPFLSTARVPSAYDDQLKMEVLRKLDCGLILPWQIP
jgi:hypothetical protein